KAPVRDRGAQARVLVHAPRRAPRNARRRAHRPGATIRWSKAARGPWAGPVLPSDSPCFEARHAQPTERSGERSAACPACGLGLPDRVGWRKGTVGDMQARMTHALLAAMFLIAAARPEPGETAPPFTLESSAGKPVSLKDLRGRSVVVAFFPKAFTSG